MAQIETTRLRRVLPHVLPVVPPIAATLLIVLQQTYYQGTHAETHINIILLVLSLLDFLPMLRKQTGDLQALHLSCVGYIDILACLYNVSIVGVPSPLSDFAAFLNSFCGIWLLAAVVELGVVIGPLIYKNHRERLAREESFSSARPPKDPDPNMEENGTGPTRTGQPFSKEDTFVSGGATAQPGSEPRGSGPQRRRRRFSLTSRTAPLLFVFLAVLLPLIPWESASAWYTSVKEIAVTVYGSWLEDNSPVTIVLLYVAMLFAIFMTLYILYLLSVYMLDRIKYRPGAGGDIFEEYSSAIALLVVAGTGALAIHHFSGDGQFSEIAAVGNLFKWMLVVIVGLITVFVLFETVRLVLHQCLERGTLLKTAMHLVFVLIVQYTVGLLTGILRVFAIRDVIESILLFFMPDLEDSIEPKLNKVFRQALKNEVEGIAEDADVKYREEYGKKRIKKGVRIRYRGGGRCAR